MRVKLFEVVSDRDKINMLEVEKVLKGKDCIRDWACILHDKDDTREHYHIAVRLKNSYDTKHIAEWFGIGENFVSKVKGRWSDMLKYLIHENAPDKYQYKEEEVFSNFDWKTEKDSDSSGGRLDEIITSIEEGGIREYNYFEYITTKEYVKYKRSIDIAFNYRTDRLKGVEREMECIFITGDSGVGKTTYAKKIALEKGLSVYISSGSNDVLDDYKGQDCIVLDDLRPSSLGLADLLKMLDNHTSSTVKSRYRNKVLECRLIIITTTLDIDVFFRNVFSEEIETSIQLKRRCRLHVRMDLDYIYLRLWQDLSREYGKEFKQPNTISAEHKAKSMSIDEQLNEIASMIGGSKDFINDNGDDSCIQIEMEAIKDNENPFDNKKIK